MTTFKVGEQARISPLAGMMLGPKLVPGAVVTITGVDDCVIGTSAEPLYGVSVDGVDVDEELFGDELEPLG